MNKPVCLDSFTFDEESHIYRLNKKVVPSVTTVMKEAGFYDHRWATEFDRDLGSAVHLTTEYHDKGELEEETLDEAITPYLEAYKKFRKESGIKIILNEQRMYHKGWKYAGTIDRIGELERLRVLIDIKTGSVQAATDVQLAGYRLMTDPYDHLKVHRAYALHLNKEGNYKLVRGKEYMKNRGTFLAALAVYNWRLDNNLIEEVA